MNKHKKFIEDNKLPDALLREFISKELWSAAVEACDEAINARKADIVKLVELKVSLQDEVFSTTPSAGSVHTVELGDYEGH